MNGWIPVWIKEYAGETFREYFTVGLSGILYYGLMHTKEVIPHISLIDIMEVDKI